MERIGWLHELAKPDLRNAYGPELSELSRADVAFDGAHCCLIASVPDDTARCFEDIPGAPFTAKETSNLGRKQMRAWVERAPAKTEAYPMATRRHS